MEDEERLRYSRHLLLPTWDEVAQERLQSAHVLLVGVGGLGSPAALYLAAAGVGTLTLCDHDKVELTNLQRQIALSQQDIGRFKVAATAQRLHQLNPEVKLRTRTEKFLGHCHSEDTSVDLVLDCSDDFSTRFAINRWCYEQHIPLVSGAVIRFNAQLTVFDFRRADTPCYACLYPPESLVEEEERCALMGVFAPLAGLLGTWQAGEAIKLITGVGTPLVGRLLLVEGEQSHFRTLTILRDPHCPVCGATHESSQ